MQQTGRVELRSVPHPLPPTPGLTHVAAAPPLAYPQAHSSERNGEHTRIRRAFRRVSDKQRSTPETDSARYPVVSNSARA
eukprot:201449-Chlamydomonas_euryale.AAC.2